MGKGGGGGGQAPAPDTTTQFIREAPGIEERKLELMDIARQTAQTPIAIPEMQIQQLSPLEQAAITQAGVTGVGSPSVGQGITATQAAMGAPNIQQFYNPYQSYVLDEINRQSAIRQNQLAAQAVGAGAFGGGRQGIQAAEEERARLGQIGQAQAAGFGTALQAAQTQQARELAGAQQLGQLGQIQQSMAGTDIQRQLAAGGLERQVAQATLDAARQTQLQRSAEPLQRIEFLSNIYAAGPKSTSGITAATLPQPSAGAQALGAGLGVAQAYQNVAGNPAVQTAKTTAGYNKGGIVDVAEIRKLKEGGPANEDDEKDFEEETLDIQSNVGALTPQQRSNLMMRPLIASLLTAERKPGQSEASAIAGALGRGLMGQQDPAMQIAKLDTALEAARVKSKKGTGKKFRTLSEDEIRGNPELRTLPMGTIVQENLETGEFKYQKPTQEEVKQKMAIATSKFQIKKMTDLINRGTGTGPLSDIGMTLDKVLGRDSDRLELNNAAKAFELAYVAALRGAQVGPKEQAMVAEILPSIYDTPAQFRAKLEGATQIITIQDAFLNGEMTQKEFNTMLNKIYGDVSKTTKQTSYKEEKDGSVTVSGG